MPRVFLRQHRLALGLGAAVFAAYMVAAGRSYDYDSSETVGAFVATPSLLDPLRRQIAFNNHPLFSLLEHMVYSAGGTSEATLRVLPLRVRRRRRRRPRRLAGRRQPAGRSRRRTATRRRPAVRRRVTRGARLQPARPLRCSPSDSTRQNPRLRPPAATDQIELGHRALAAI
jgi:hypothetical protein